jgi:hypothetical protein
MQTRTSRKRRSNDDGTRAGAAPSRKSTRTSKPTARAAAAAAQAPRRRTAKRTVKRTSKQCQPYEAYDRAYDIMRLLRQRKAAETTASKLQKRIQSLDATVWRHYNDIVKGTCSSTAFKHLFKAMDERLPLEEALEKQKKAMHLVDEQIRGSKYALGLILKNVNRYVGTSSNNIEENLR